MKIYSIYLFILVIILTLTLSSGLALFVNSGKIVKCFVLQCCYLLQSYISTSTYLKTLTRSELRIEHSELFKDDINHELLS